MTERLGKRPYARDVGRLATPLKGRTYHRVPITHTSFDGDSFSDVAAATKIENTSWSRTIPADAKAILIQVAVKDSAGFPTGGLYFTVGPQAYPYAVAARPLGGDHVASNTEWCPCEEGDIWYLANASGANTMEVTLRVWGWET